MAGLFFDELIGLQIVADDFRLRYLGMLWILGFG